MSEQNTQGQGPLSPKERKAKYKKTLNLPKTSFPMRANLAQNEGQTRKRWEKADLHDAIQKRRASDPVFAFPRRPAVCQRRDPRGPPSQQGVERHRGA